MKLVIEIPEPQYRTLNAASQNDVVAVVDDALLIKAIKNGTPLVDVLTDFVEWENLPFPKKNVFMNAPVIIAKTYLEEKKDADSD